MINVAISGCCGRMGGRILDLARKDPDFQVKAILEHLQHPSINKPLAGLTVSADTGEIEKADVLIEFTTPEATIEHLDICLKFQKAMVIGTTGLNEQQKENINERSKNIPIVFSPNMSVGVNLLFALVKTAAAKLGKDYKVNITEAHHAHKKDAPSGTAKKLAEIVKKFSNQDTDDIKSIREGEIIGDHRIIFEGPLEKIELFHSAKTRDIFAAGALVAAKWIVNKKNGLFTMQDMLNLD